MRVFIADDEQGIVELIKHLITVEKCEIVGEANNGLDALHKIREQQPDIVITDIMMPLMNGIDLIREVLKTLPQTQFVVISGYREFEYAKSALLLGVQDFLLKPFKQSELNGILEKLVASKEKKISRDKDMEQQYIRTREMLRKDYANRLLHNVSTEEEDIPDVNGEKIFHFGTGAFQCAVIKASTEEYDLKEGNQITTLLEDLCRKIKVELETVCEEVEYIIVEKRGFFLMQYRNGTSVELAECMEKIGITINNLNYKFNFMRICMGLSDADGTLENIREKYKQAVSAITYRYERPKECIFCYDAAYNRKTVTKVEYLQYLKDCGFSSGVERMDPDALGRILDKTWQKYVEKDADGKCVCGQADAVVHYFLNELHSTVAGVLGVELNGFSMYTRILETVDNHYDLRTLYRDLNAYLTACMEYCHKIIGEKESKPIRMAKEYVNAHYAENFNLDDIARLVCLSPNYFSILFKNEVGQGFNSYQQNVRMERAKELLKTTQMRVGDVAREVGYADLKYFTKLFVKSVGVKPMEYRNFYS